MRLVTRHVLVIVVLVALATAVPVALSPTTGWAAAVAVAGVGALAVAVFVWRRYVRPLDELAGAIAAPGQWPELRTEDLARLVASEYRVALESLEATSATDRRQKAALAHASDGVALLDAHGAVEYANPVARWLVHDRVLDLTRRIAQPEIEVLVQRARDTQAPVTEEVTLRIPEARHVIARAVPLGDGGCVLLFQDRTEANRLDRMRRDFVANVSHELKTPVASIRALAEVARTALADPDLDTALRFVDRLQVEAERLSRLVGDLLDLSRVEAEGRRVQRERVDLRPILETAAEQARAMAEAKGVEITVSGGGVAVDADAAQLGMAVQNLVDNAVRYSDEGTIALSACLEEGWALISVADQGIGIPTDELPRIFERFYRVDRARSRATGGTGLGLAIVRHVAENHGGRVEVSSELGRGSTFTLHLPSPSTDREGTAA